MIGRVQRIAFDTIVRSKVNTQHVRYGSGQLLIVEYSIIGSLTQNRDSGSEHHKPGLTGSSQISSMAMPLFSTAPTMVAKEHVSGLSFVERIGLAKLNYTADETVSPVSDVEIPVIPVVMGKFIGVTKTHIKHLGMILLEGFHGITEGKCIITFFSPVSRHCILHLVKDYRLDIVEQRLKVIQQQLQQASSDMELTMKLLKDHKETKELRDMLAKQLGNDLMV